MYLWCSSIERSNVHYSYSLLPALSLDGVIAAHLLEGSFTTPTFLDFIRATLKRMNPFPGKNSVLIMDNARIHRHPTIVKTICEMFVAVARIYSLLALKSLWTSGCRILYLPAYSPDFNPIELAFSKIKAHVRRHGNITWGEEGIDSTDVYTFLYEAAFSVTPDDAAGWYHHCGYI